MWRAVPLTAVRVGWDHLGAGLENGAWWEWVRWDMGRERNDTSVVPFPPGTSRRATRHGNRTAVRGVSPGVWCMELGDVPRALSGPFMRHYEVFQSVSWTILRD